MAAQIFVINSDEEAEAKGSGLTREERRGVLEPRHQHGQRVSVSAPRDKSALDQRCLTTHGKHMDGEDEHDGHMDPTASFDVDREIAEAQVRREQQHQREAHDIFGTPPKDLQHDDAHEGRRRGSPVGARMETARAARAQALQRGDAQAGHDESDKSDKEGPQHRGTTRPEQDDRRRALERQAQQEADDLLENMAEWIDRSGDDQMMGEEKKNTEDPTTPIKRARRSHAGGTTPEKRREDGTGSNFHLTTELQKEMTPTQVENTQEAREAETRTTERRTDTHRGKELPRPAGQPATCGPPRAAPRQDSEQAQRPGEHGGRERAEKVDEHGEQATRRPQEITPLADLADLIKNENAELKRDLGERLWNVENHYVHLAEAQQQLRDRQDRAEEKQQKRAKHLSIHDNEIRELKSTTKKATTATTDQIKDMERRIQGLEKAAVSSTGQETGAGDVVVIRGFARDTKQSDIVDFLQGLLRDIAYEGAAEAYAPFRRGSIGKVRFPTAQAARAAIATLRRAAPARAQAECLGTLWVAPERSAADAARARPWTRAAWLAREKL